MRLDGRVAVVTGASRGLGRVMARALANEGAHVVCAARSAGGLRETVEELDAGPGAATAVTADLRSWDDVRALVSAAEDLGGVDVLVNNAGVNQESMTGGEEDGVVDVPVERWDAVVETNLRGPFLCSKAALGSMLSAGAGQLVHVGSSHGRRGRPDRAPYCASKFGLEGFHQSLSLELRGTGVASTILAPPRGGVVTGMTDHRPDERLEPLHPAEVMGEPAVKLAAGEGDNGGRYRATEDGEGLETVYTLADFT